MHADGLFKMVEQQGVRLELQDLLTVVICYYFICDNVYYTTPNANSNCYYGPFKG